MFSEFAYSVEMQLILALIVFIQPFVYIYFIADVILRVYKESVRSLPVALYVCLSGTLLYAMWIYGLYFIMGAEDFPPLLYLLITTPNPAFAVFHYFAGIKALKLSRVRSFTFMSKIYLFHMLTRSISRLVKSLLLNAYPLEGVETKAGAIIICG